MKSRIARTTITVLSVGILFLLGLLICTLNPGRVNAQRTNPTLENRAFNQFPAVSSPPVISSANTYQETPPSISVPFTSISVPFSNQPAQFNSQPNVVASGTLTQPIVVEIKGGPELRGEPVNLVALHVKTIFGAVSIPVDRIAGVRTGDDSRQPATICLSNGDSITGELSADSITVKTEWGTATIARDHIVSIVTSTVPVTWQQHENRWKIVPVTTATPATEATETIQPVSELDAGATVPQALPPTLETQPPSTPEPTRLAPVIKY